MVLKRPYRSEIYPEKDLPKADPLMDVSDCVESSDKVLSQEGLDV